MAQALAQGYLWREAEVALKGCGIGIGGGDIAWLHGDNLVSILNQFICIYLTRAILS